MDRINRRKFLVQGSFAGASLPFMPGSELRFRTEKAGRTLPEVFREGSSCSMRCGFARENITPSRRLFNWVTGNPYGDTLHPIHLTACIWNDGNVTVVIVSFELVYVGESLTALLKDRISSTHRIPEDQILITATHNHSAPFSPVYMEEMRSLERDLSWGSLGKIREEEDVPEYHSWKNSLIEKALRAVERARRSANSGFLWIGKADISRWVHQRRPRPVSVDIEDSKTPANFNFRHEQWDPEILSGNMNFGSLDRTMNVLFFEHEGEDKISTIFNLSAHAVSVYPYHDGISGDWPGVTTEAFQKEFGGESLFLQGTTGDVNPWKRGLEAVNEMAAGLTDLARRAYQHAARVHLGPIRCQSAFIGLPLTEYGKIRTGRRSMEIEIQAIAMGTVAIVSLPGEPMTDIGMSIKNQSPFPHTLVLGYSNGVGTQYIGMPGEEDFGGYEAGEKRRLAVDQAGVYMVGTAVDLLNKLYTNG